MEELWQEVFHLEGEGKFNEAAEVQARRLVEIKRAYDEATNGQGVEDQSGEMGAT